MLLFVFWLFHLQIREFLQSTVSLKVLNSFCFCVYLISFLQLVICCSFSFIFSEKIALVWFDFHLQFWYGFLLQFFFKKILKGFLNTYHLLLGVTILPHHFLILFVLFLLIFCLFSFVIPFQDFQIFWKCLASLTYRNILSRKRVSRRPYIVIFRLDYIVYLIFIENIIFLSRFYWSIIINHFPALSGGSFNFKIFATLSCLLFLLKQHLLFNI